MSDGGRPPEVSVQTRASNRPGAAVVQKTMVVSNSGKRRSIREQIPAGQNLALSPRVTPPRAQPLEQYRRQQCVAVLLTLALLDAQEHPLAVNVADLQGNDFADAKSRTIRDRQRRAVFERTGALDEAACLETKLSLPRERFSALIIPRRSAGSAFEPVLRGNDLVRLHASPRASANAPPSHRTSGPRSS